MNKTRGLPRPVLAVIGIAATLLAGCGVGESSHSGDQERIYEVQTAVVATQDIIVAFEGTGTVYASQRADLRWQVDGILAEIAVAEGDRVQKGDLVARLDDSKAVASLALERAQLDSAKATLKVSTEKFSRARRLVAEKLLSTEEFEALEAENAAAEASMREHGASVQLAEQTLEDYGIRAPFAGRIGLRHVDIGNYVERGAMLTTLMATDPVEVRFAAPERYTRVLNVGSAIDVSDSTGTVQRSGTLVFIDALVNVRTRMLILKASIPNPDGSLLPGQFVEGNLVYERQPDQVVVPEEAVVSYSGESWVFVVEDGRAHRRRVTLGIRNPGVVQIVEGVHADTTIVVAGQHRLSDGAKVHDADSATPAAQA